MINLKRILAPTDFSKFSDNAMRYACEFAAKFEADLHVLTVVDSSSTFLVDPEFMPIEDFVAEQESAAQKMLEEQPNFPSSESLSITRVLKVGTPFVEIVRYAKEADIDLIVVGTHGRSGLSHVLMGSVAERVVRKAPCPVLTIRSPEHEFVMP